MIQNISFCAAKTSYKTTNERIQKKEQLKVGDIIKYSTGNSRYTYLVTENNPEQDRFYIAKVDNRQPSTFEPDSITRIAKIIDYQA